jgi:SsrA-binding protein
MPILLENKRARYDYEILEKYEAGIQLAGLEVKSARLGRMNLAGAYAVIRPSASSGRSPSAGSGLSPSAGSGLSPSAGSGLSSKEVWLLNADIPPYQSANAPAGYESSRTRKLLLKKSEIKELIGKLSQKGLTLLPLKVYTKGKRNLIKIELGLARGRKTRDKRELIKKRDARIEIARTLKRN